MSDRMAVFNRGRIEQVGTPAEVYERPATGFVAGFVGVSNVLEGSVARRSPATTHAFTIRPEKIAMVEPGRAGAVRTSARQPDTSARSYTWVPDQVRRRPRRGRRAGRDAAEPDHVLDGGAAGARARPCGWCGNGATTARSTTAGGREGSPDPGGGRMTKRSGGSPRERARARRCAACGERQRDGVGHRRPDRGAAGRRGQRAIGPGEGELNLIAWNGYTRTARTTRATTGCTRSRTRPAAR